MKRLRVTLIAGTAVAALALSACSSDPAPAAQPSTPATSSSSADTSATAADAVKLMVAHSDKLGDIITDGKGMTLYRFDKDTASPSASNCEGQCLAAWPPVLAGSGEPELSGVDKAAVGTVTRKDGTKQLTVAGWPLYTYAKDKAAGDVTGQAVGGVWWAVTPAGAKAAAA